MWYITAPSDGPFSKWNRVRVFAGQALVTSLTLVTVISEMPLVVHLLSLDVSLMLPVSREERVCVRCMPSICVCVCLCENER